MRLFCRKTRAKKGIGHSPGGFISTAGAINKFILGNLLFIYRANSSKSHKFWDILHKVLRPSTYSCGLCKLTYGAFKEKKEWKNFRKSTNVAMEFLYADEFRKQYASKFGYKFDFPIILEVGQDGLQVLVAAEEINKMENVNQLIGLIEQRLS